METIKYINYVIMILFFICYSYQFAFILISWFSKKVPKDSYTIHDFAVLIAARNEEAVIGNLIDSIRDQNYSDGKIKIFVVADNCTDNTSKIAKLHGATVFKRYDKTNRGKGYALNFLINKIKETKGLIFDAYIVFDADNVIDSNFVSEINKTYSNGYDIVTCYRNSKNYGDNWISAGYSLWFMREARYLNQPRFSIKSNCALSGTGFLFSNEVINKCGGWNFFCLTEDIEFTIYNVLNGAKIGYCKDAILYDEQPTSFLQSWTQRLRWAKGYLQVLTKYWKSLLNCILHGNFSCYDMTMCIMPATILTIVSIIINATLTVINFFKAENLLVISESILQSCSSLYLILFFIGAITVITEWNKIHCNVLKKILYTFTFPLFMLTYIPICITALFKTPKWDPIYHNRNVNIKQICKTGK